MSSTYNHAEFLKSAAAASQAPPDRGAEVAFAGRSNAGKSSALNAITGRRTLARTSKTPGRTQLINFFRLDTQRRLVDLPGYGYARVPPDVKRNWQHALEEYLRTRRSLRGVMLVMDIRHPLTDYDQQMLGWCAHLGLECHVLLTKADKLSHGAASAVLLRVRKALEQRFDLDSVQLFSALRQIGLDEARARLDAWLELGEGE